MSLDFICIDPERQLDRARESAIGALATLPVDVVFLHLWLPLALQRQHVLLQADGYIIAGLPGNSAVTTTLFSPSQMFIGGKSRAVVALYPENNRLISVLHSPQLDERIETQSGEF